MKESELRKLIREEVKKVMISEADIIPTAPDGTKIEDPKIINNLNMAIKAISSNLRSKVIQIIEDPEAVKELKTPAQKAALLGAFAIAFGITEEDFKTIITKIKNVLPSKNDQA
jgi:hypothetical protein